MEPQRLADRAIQPNIASSPQLLLKAPVEPFQLPNPAVRNIRFLHPGYPENENILLIFPALTLGATTMKQPRLTVGVDGVLTHPSYYFCIDGVPSFDHFRFPSNLPDSWSSNISAPIQRAAAGSISDRDRTCRITCSSLPNEVARIIPAPLEEWWERNSMFVHTARPWSGAFTNYPENAVLLRRDLRYIWDNHQFALVPKQGRWVVHILDNQTTDELQERYHNLETQPIMGVAREYLFARFALAILVQMSVFMKQESPQIDHAEGQDAAVKGLVHQGILRHVCSTK
ncbi:hypothetical protein AJ79_05345 [Helicocarpus griseus UAMH5409]|uniref:Uncharacterized protein n=1 Tax=Helicocarpus griseus UAMH5409 TaxID=1447875 RepID=A0A2B7XPE0_9EURO|nr:hypothetical protein AJ79_05345 [Helicocarpus griseus UAMH5409]